MSNSPNPSSLTYETNPFEQSFANRIQNAELPNQVTTPGPSNMNPQQQARPDQRVDPSIPALPMLQDNNALYSPYNFYNVASPIPLLGTRLGPPTPSLYGQLSADQLVVSAAMANKQIHSPRYQMQYPQIPLPQPNGVNNNPNGGPNGPNGSGVGVGPNGPNPNGFNPNGVNGPNGPNSRPNPVLPNPGMPNPNAGQPLMPEMMSMKQQAQQIQPDIHTVPQIHNDQPRSPNLDANLATPGSVLMSNLQPQPGVPNPVQPLPPTDQDLMVKAENHAPGRKHSSKDSTEPQSKPLQMPENAAASGLFMLSKEQEQKPKSRANLRPHIEDEEERRKQSLERNRLAALKSRRRKKQWVGELQRNADFYFKHSQILEQTVAELRNDIDQMKEFVMKYHDLSMLPRNIMELITKPSVPIVEVPPQNNVNSKRRKSDE